MISTLVEYIIIAIFRVLNVVERCSVLVLNRPLLKLDKHRLYASLSEDVLRQLEDEDVREPVELNLEALKESNNMSFLARMLHYNSLKGALEMRANVDAAVRENPALTQTPITKPVFIIGLPRTGTTLLLNILAQEPRFCAPMTWELVSPLPADFSPAWRESQRYIKTVKKLEFYRKLTGYSFDEVHIFKPELPEECHFLLRFSFYIYTMFLRLPVLTALQDWFYARDKRFMQKMYRHYKTLLQIVGHGHGMEEKRFLLKSHLHNMDLMTLLETFPDAYCIFTYRNLSDVVPSFCSLIDTTTRHYIEKPDKEFGNRARKMAFEVVNRATRSMKQIKKDQTNAKQIMLLPYEQLVKNPSVAIENVYSFLGMTYTSGMRESVEKYIMENPKNKHGRHKYQKEDYGVTEEEINEKCHEYFEFIKQTNPDGEILLSL